MPYPDPKHFKTPLKRALGTGSAHHGALEWWHARASSIFLVPLAIWLFLAFAGMAREGMTYGETLQWIQKPYHAFPLILFFVVFFYHCSIAAKDVIIDYVSCHKKQILSLLALNVYCYGLMALSVFSVLYITFKL